LFKQESMTTGGKKNLTLVKPTGPLFIGPERSGLFHEGLTDTPAAGAFQSGLPEKAIELPGPLVQQAIARAIAGLSESQAFQAMDTSKMAKVNRLAHQVPKDAVHEDQVDAQKLLGDDDGKGKAAQAKPQDGDQLEAAVGQEEPTDSSESVGQVAQAGATDPHEDELRDESLAAVSQEGDLAEQPVSGLVTDGLTQADPTGADPTQADLIGADPTQAASTEADSTQVDPTQADRVRAASPEADPTQVDPTQADLIGADPTQAASTEAHPTQAAAGEGESADAKTLQAGEESVDTEADPASDNIQPEVLQQVSRSDLEQLHQEAFEAGRQATLEELANAAPPAPSEEMLDVAREEAFQKGYEEGYTKAEAAVKDELQAEVELASQSLNDLTAKLAEAARDTDAFYAPLLNLSMHLAEQLVRGELTLSSKAVQRLIETCLMEFDQEATAPVVIRMHPDDLARFEQDDALLPKNMILRPDPNVLIGSVKVQMNGALIEDLMQHRAQVLWHSLMQGQEAGDLPDSFLRNVALVKEAFDEVDASDEVFAAEVTDIAQPDPTEIEEAASETPNNNQKGDPL
jgi:flagellar biosynthesis/type III secretory pathway protein FliH